MIYDIQTYDPFPNAGVPADAGVLADGCSRHEERRGAAHPQSHLLEPGVC